METSIPLTKYKSNFLTEAIVRIDFINPIEAIDKELPKKIKSKILKYFEVLEPQAINLKSIDLENEKFLDQQINSTEWKFFSLNRDKQLSLTREFFFISYKRYSSYSILSKEFIEIVKSIFTEFSALQIKRLGLRYINEINFPQGNPLEWSDYIHNGLLTIGDFINDKKYLARTFHVMAFNYGNYNLKFQFGIHNPDYPAPIRQKVFILDYDAYSTGIDKESIANNLDLLHATIQLTFENSILDGLRNVLNG